MAELSLETVELELLELLKELGVDFSSLDAFEKRLRSAGKAEADVLASESREILYHLFELRSALRTNPDFFELGRSRQVYR